MVASVNPRILLVLYRAAMALYQCGTVNPNDAMTVGSRVRDVSSMMPIPGLKRVHIDQPYP